MSNVLSNDLAGSGLPERPSFTLSGWFARLLGGRSLQRARRKPVAADPPSPELEQARRDVNRLLDATLRARRDAAGLASLPGDFRYPARTFLDDRWLR